MSTTKKDFLQGLQKFQPRKFSPRTSRGNNQGNFLANRRTPFSLLMVIRDLVYIHAPLKQTVNNTPFMTQT